MKYLSTASTLFIIIAIVIMAFTGKPKEQPERLELSENVLGCMVMAIYHEARGEDALGQVAVAQVVLNRVKAPGYPKTICGVVWQDHQFSFTNDGHSDRMTDLNAIQKAVDVALAVSRGKVRDVTGGALNYYAHKRVKPSWAKSGFRFILGEHTFVRLSGR
jgi:spore germination cell wall hydrolase CwlJ-like protein